MKTTRVLHVLWRPHFGGIEKLVHDLAVDQSRRGGLEAAVFFGRREGGFQGKFLDSGLDCRFGNLRGGLDLSPAAFLAALKLFKGFDILHFHTFNPLLASAAVRSERPVVYTEHGNFGFGRKRKASDVAKNMLLKRFLNRRARYVTFNSRFTRGCAEERYGLGGVERSVLYNGISFEEGPEGSQGVEAELSGEARASFVVGTVSRFAGFKRIDRLLEAFARFREGREALLLLVGDGPLRGDLEKKSRELGIARQTVFAGFRTDVRDCLSLMDVCVFPSEKEPFGLAALEAMALGKPALAFRDGGGLAEVLSRYSGELLVDGVPGLVERLNACYDDADRLKAEAGARTAFARKFDIRTMTDGFTGIYRSLL